jgi:hypothetical protein
MMKRINSPIETVAPILLFFKKLPCIFLMSCHFRSINFKALNLHFPRQSPQAVHLSGYFTVARFPVSSSTASNTWRWHLLMQRRHPVQLFLST